MSKRNQTLYDVTIVDTGPAGSLLAYELARTGWAAPLLGKKLPRYKTCCGGLTQRALDLIPFDIDDVIEDRAHTIQLRVGYKTAFTETRQPPTVHLVMRDRLDYRCPPSVIICLNDMAPKSVLSTWLSILVP